jgi:hypothetical protein
MGLIGSHLDITSGGLRTSSEMRQSTAGNRFPIILSDDMIPAAVDRGGSCRNDQPDSGVPPTVLEKGFVEIAIRAPWDSGTEFSAQT